MKIGVYKSRKVLKAPVAEICVDKNCYCERRMNRQVLAKERQRAKIFKLNDLLGASEKKFHRNLRPYCPIVSEPGLRSFTGASRLRYGRTLKWLRSCLREISISIH